MNPSETRLDRQRVLDWPTRYPWPVLLVTLVCVLASILLIRTIDTDGSLESMLPQHDSSSAALSAIAESFGLADNATVLVQSPADQPANPPDLIEFAERFALAFDSTRLPSDPPCRVRSTWPGEAQAWTRQVVAPNLLLYLDKSARETLKYRLTSKGMAERFAQAERTAAAPGIAGSAMSSLLEDPLGLTELVTSSYEGWSDAGVGKPGSPMLSSDGRSLMIQVSPIDPTGEIDQANAVVAAVHRAIERAESNNLGVSVGGGLAIADAAERSIRRDMIISSIGTMILLQLLFLATFRKLLLFPVALMPAVVGALVGFGVFALTGRSLSPPTAVLGALLAGMGIDYAIHYLAHTTAGEPLPQVNRRLSRPLIIACVTSVIAMLTLIASDVSALRDFATIGAVGLAATLVASLMLLPALLKVLAPGTSDRSTTFASTRWAADGLIPLVIKRPKIAYLFAGLTACAAVLVLALHPGGPIHFDRDLGNMHPQPNAPLQTQQAIAEAFEGQGETLMLYLTADREEALVSQAARCRELLRTDPQTSLFVAGSFGIDMLVPSKQQLKTSHAFAETIDATHAQATFDEAVNNSIFNPEAFADYRKALGDLLRPGDGPTLSTLSAYPELSAGLLPRDATSTDLSAAEEYEAVSFVSVSHTMQTRQQRAEVIDAIRRALTDVPGVTLTGLTVVGHDVETQVRYELPRLLGIAGLAAFLWIGLCYRSVRDLMLAFLPVILGLIVTFAVMRATGIGLNLLNLVALPLLIGLGIDDGVFMVSIARECRRRKQSRVELFNQLASSAQAITLTTITTTLAFGSLTLTAVPAMQALGVVMAIGMVACWAVTVGLLAPLLIHRAAPIQDATPTNTGSMA